MKFLPLLVLLGTTLSLPAQEKGGTDPPARSAAVQAVMQAMGRNDAAAAFHAASAGRDKGDAACTYLLGQMHELGHGVPTANPAKAFALYEEAAQAGVPEALTAYARCLESGTGTAVNLPKAMFYWQKAAESGDPPAMGRMGQAELEGLGRPANPAAALPWLEKAAAARDPLGMWLLSRCYDTGRAGLTPSIEKAVQLCTKAARAGQVEAIQRMGELYATGRGLPNDPVAATGWFRHAADYGHVPAYVSLALCYLNGTGCRQNDRIAFEFATAAAKAGHPRGFYLLGRIYEEGLGLPPDPISGLTWHLRAYLNGVPEAKTAVERLKKSLKPEQIRQAEAMAARPEEPIGQSKPSKVP
jgi:TPR repeat protein